ncbi:MAG TPA: carboxypeptidase regulatory-like domain-containing protein [Gemmatimonadaceae bacterium]|nr:carboxypeptidase regulatory-like domain-containing protein [Gemmatimonadaceae bacterium]
MRRSVVFPLILSLAVASDLLAQQRRPPARRPAATKDTAAKDTAKPVVPSQPFGSVFGTVFDSVHNAPLAGAMVTVDGTNRFAVTTDKGAFKVDSITPGKYVLRVTSDLLDSLGMVLVTDSVPVSDGAVVPVALGIPAQETLVAASCTAGQRALGPSALIGRVLEAETDKPVAKARVSFAWSEISLRDNLRRLARVRDATTGSDGVYRICGLPPELTGTVQAFHSGVSTAEVKVTFEGQPLVIQGLKIGSAETVVATTDSAALARAKANATGPRFSATTVRKGQAVLTGRVVNGAGQPIVGARVDVVGTPGATLTRDNGEFSLNELPSGTQTVVVRQIGFAPVEQAVELSTRAPQRVTVALTRAAQVLAPVAITASADAGLDKVGFNQRRRGAGGYFITADDIAKRSPNVLTDVFRTVPSLRVVPSGTDYVIENARNPMNGCVKYYIDGSPWEALFPGDVDRLLPAWEIAAIEVYNGASTPMQFQAPGASNCASIVIWSKTRTGMNRR